jgi:sarcosine oxidase subunit gamma
VPELSPTLALGTGVPRSETIGAVTLTEVPDLALASVAARRGQEVACAGALADLLGAPAPGPNAATLSDPYAAVWMAQDQWMVGAADAPGADLAGDLAGRFARLASVTEQTGAWVTIDASGSGTVDLFERLCPAPARRMQAGTAQRTTIHQMGCFLVCGAPGAFFRVLGPQSSAGSLWHALHQAALSVR